jgi:hypothetical protein
MGKTSNRTNNLTKFWNDRHMGVAESTIQCRLHRGKESITEMWRREIHGDYLFPANLVIYSVFRSILRCPRP